MSLLNKASIVTTPTSYENGKILSVKPSIVLGNELITNGNFSDGANNWLLTGSSFWVNSSIEVPTGGLTQLLTLENNKTYKITFDVIQGSGINGGVYVNTNYNSPVFADNVGITTTGVGGTYTFTFTMNGIGNGITLTRRVNNQDIRIDNVSVKEAIDADFDFTRNSSATRVNSQGLIEDITSNLPRIDYTGGEGHWLFEPQSTQTATYSNDFTQGDLFNSSQDPALLDTVLTSQQATSPDGTNNAWKLVDNNDGLTGQASLSYFSTTVIANNYNTISYFVKKQGSNNFVYIDTFGFDAGANGRTWFDIQNGTLGNVSANHTANIQNYGNGWYRISITIQAVTDTVGGFSLRLATSNGAGNVLRDGTNGVYLFGVQAESDASHQFMTSYIPTNGSNVTRLADAAYGAGSSDLINSTEGVLYAEAAKLNDNSLDYKAIGFNNGSQQERLVFIFGTGGEKIRFQVRTNNVIVFQDDFNVTSLSQQNKIAVRYSNTTGYAFFINGLKVGVNSSLIVPQITRLGFGVSGANFFGKTKCVAVFKEALTDDELTCLTTI